jgi:hypothetical protein
MIRGIREGGWGWPNIWSSTPSCTPDLKNKRLYTDCSTSGTSSCCTFLLYVRCALKLASEIDGPVRSDFPHIRPPLRVMRACLRNVAAQRGLPLGQYQTGGGGRQPHLGCKDYCITQKLGMCNDRSADGPISALLGQGLGIPPGFARYPVAK